MRLHLRKEFINLGEQFFRRRVRLRGLARCLLRSFSGQGYFHCAWTMRRFGASVKAKEKEKIPLALGSDAAHVGVANRRTQMSKSILNNKCFAVVRDRQGRDHKVRNTETWGSVPAPTKLVKVPALQVLELVESNRQMAEWIACHIDVLRAYWPELANLAEAERIESRGRMALLAFSNSLHAVKAAASMFGDKP